MRAQGPLLLFFVLLDAGGGAWAQSGKGPVVIDINNVRRDLYRIAVPGLVGDPETGRMFGEVVSGNLSVSGWFKVLEPKSFLANLVVEGTGIVLQDWRSVGAEGVSKGKATVSGGQVTLELKLYEVGRGAEPVLSKSYQGTLDKARAFAHAWSNEVVKYFAGEEGFFSTQIVFAGSTGTARKDIFVMDYDGANVHQLTNNGSQNILPTWSPSGDRIAFTSFIRGNPDLFVVPIGGGRPKRLSDRPGVNMGAAFSPDGSRIALTLSKDGNPELFLINSGDGTILSKLTNTRDFINTSPAWSPDGARLVFVSNRRGAPGIWSMSADGSNPTRIMIPGSYNQEPAWCPKCQSPTLAFTARDEKSRFDVFTIPLGGAANQIVRLTENQGNNEHPSWAPNGRALAIASSRGGIWIITADGKTQRQVYKGNATAPSWGPARKSPY